MYPLPLYHPHPHNNRWYPHLYHQWGCHHFHQGHQVSTNLILTCMKVYIFFYLSYLNNCSPLWYLIFHVFFVFFFYYVQSNLYLEVTFRTKKKWPYKTGDFLKEVQFIWIFLWQDKKTFNNISIILWQWFYLQKKQNFLEKPQIFY